MLYNVLISAKILKESGSKAEIVLMVQMQQLVKSQVLPDEDVRLLTALDVRIQYLPAPEGLQTFYSCQLQKFRILSMVEYSRVIYVDSDVMPFCNLDYLFELSEPEDVTQEAILKENIILAWTLEPAHGGFFMLSPGQGEYEQVQSIIARQEEKAMTLPPPKRFDAIEGWGHVITPPDRWQSLLGREMDDNHNNTIWDWYGDFADQGLLYYWTKYYKKSVSIVIGRNVENWSNSNGKPALEKTSWSKTPAIAIAEHSCLPPGMDHLGQYAATRSCFRGKAPYRDFYHFVSKDIYNVSTM
jgi:hypothetical protein